MDAKLDRGAQDPDDPDEASQLAGIAALIRISEEQRANATTEPLAAVTTPPMQAA
jgi:hypothetical protein